MNLKIKIVLICSMFSVSFNLIAQRTDVIYGSILSQNDSTPVINAHIVNINSKKGVVSDINGDFSIKAENKDTLKISIIGFQTKEIICSQVIKIIYLKRKNHELLPFTVLPYRNFSEFKDAFVHFELKDDTPPINQSIFLSKEELKSYDGSRGISGGISAILGHFNKYVQDKENYEKLIKQDLYKAQLAKRFNSQLVKRATSLDNENKISAFMEYCDFSDRFIELSSEYELTTQIIDCYQEFNALSKINE